jgi:hypothetical protein
MPREEFNDKDECGKRVTVNQRSVDQTLFGDIKVRQTNALDAGDAALASRLSNTVEVLPTHCELLPRPNVTDRCTVGACQGASALKWVAQPWTEVSTGFVVSINNVQCTVTCGTGTQRRRMYCTAPNGTQVDSEQCINSGMQQPARRQSCSPRLCT